MLPIPLGNYNTNARIIWMHLCTRCTQWLLLKTLLDKEFGIRREFAGGNVRQSKPTRDSPTPAYTKVLLSIWHRMTVISM